MPSQFDPDFLTAALAGYEARLKEIDQRIADLRQRIAGPRVSSAPAVSKAPVKKRVLSAEGRARIIAAVQRRWAEARSAKTEESTPVEGSTSEAPVVKKPKGRPKRA